MLKGGLIKPLAVTFYLDCLYFHFLGGDKKGFLVLITANEEFSMVCLNVALKAASRQSLSSPFSANFLLLNGKLWKRKRFPGSLSSRFEQQVAEHDGIFTHETRQEKPHLSILLIQLHFELPAKFKVGSMTPRLAAWSLSTCFKMAAADAEFWASLESNFSE